MILFLVGRRGVGRAGGGNGGAGCGSAAVPTRLRDQPGLFQISPALAPPFPPEKQANKPRDGGNFSAMWEIRHSADTAPRRSQIKPVAKSMQVSGAGRRAACVKRVDARSHEDLRRAGSSTGGGRKRQTVAIDSQSLVPSCTTGRMCVCRPRGVSRKGSNSEVGLYRLGNMPRRFVAAGAARGRSAQPQVSTGSARRLHLLLPRACRSAAACCVHF